MHITSLLISMQAGGSVRWTGAWNANQNLCILSFFRLCGVAVSSAQFLLNLFIHPQLPHLFLGTRASENSAFTARNTDKQNQQNKALCWIRQTDLSKIWRKVAKRVNKDRER